MLGINTFLLTKSKLLTYLQNVKKDLKHESKFRDH